MFYTVVAEDNRIKCSSMSLIRKKVRRAIFFNLSTEVSKFNYFNFYFMQSHIKYLFFDNVSMERFPQYIQFLSVVPNSENIENQLASKLNCCPCKPKMLKKKYCFLLSFRAMEF